MREKSSPASVIHKCNCILQPAIQLKGKVLLQVAIHFLSSALLKELKTRCGGVTEKETGSRTYGKESNGVDSQLVNVGVSHDCGLEVI